MKIINFLGESRSMINFIKETNVFQEITALCSCVVSFFFLKTTVNLPGHNSPVHFGAGERKTQTPSV